MTVAATVPRTARTSRTDVVVLAVAAVVLRIPAFFASKALHTDDGFYGMSVVAMRGGGIPYRDVFSSQGPLHLPLLYAGDLIGLGTLDAPRTASMVAGIVTAIAVWACARLLGATERIALLVGILVATTGTMLWATGQI